MEKSGKFLLTAKEEERLFSYLKENVGWLCPNPDLILDKECAGESCFPHRFFFWSMPGLLKTNLCQMAGGEPSDDGSFSNMKNNRTSTIILKYLIMFKTILLLKKFVAGKKTL